MFKNLKIRLKILLLLLLISMATSIIIGFIVFTHGANTLKDDTYKKLTAIRELKANQIENYFQQIFDQAITFSEDRMVIEAVMQFKNGFDSITSEFNYSKENLVRFDSILHDYYETHFLNKLFYQDSTIKYFQLPRKELLESQNLWKQIVGSKYSSFEQGQSFPNIPPITFNGNISIQGSFTVSSLVEHIVTLFNSAGATGVINYLETGTSVGLNNLVNGSKIDIVGSSHQLTQDNIQLFEDAGLTPASFRIGTDALVTVVSERNNFIRNLSFEELKMAFTTADKWSDINPEWPDEFISRFIPSDDSGVYKLFSRMILDGDEKILVNSSNTVVVEDIDMLHERMSTERFSIAFFSYNNIKNDLDFNILDINGVNLNSTNIGNNSYTLTRDLYLITTESKLQTNDNVAVLINYFLNTVDKEIGVSLSESDYWSPNQRSRVLQYQYIADNPFPQGEKDNLVKLQNNSIYNKVHQLYHPIFKNYLDLFGFYDIFLIDGETGNIIYTVAKEIDFATNITHGPFFNTKLANVYNRALNSSNPNYIDFEDFSPYLPSYNAPAAFIGSPIFNGRENIGVLVFQVPIDGINHIMTDGYEWEEVGLGKTGVTYLVGHDNLMRNQSRLLVENPEEYFLSLNDHGLSNDIISKIKILNSSIGLQPVNTLGTISALTGEIGTQIFPNYHGAEVLSAYKPLNLDKVHWVIMSEIHKSEAFAAIPIMFKKFLFWLICILILVIIVSLYFARTISKPIQILTQHASGLAKGNLDDSIKIDQNDEIGLLANSVETMRLSLKEVIGNLNEANQHLEKRVLDRTKELNNEKAFLKLLINSIPDLIFYKDTSSNYIGANTAFKKFLNLQRKDFIGKSDTALFPKEEADKYILADQEIIKSLKSKTYENYITDHKGSKRTFETLKTPFYTDSGKVIGIIGISRDISEHKKLQEILFKANERMEGELNVAREIQMNMLPLKSPAFSSHKEIKIRAELIPAREVGGDFYDYYFLDENHLCFVVGDVSGKGVPAALMMAVTITLLKSRAGSDWSTASIMTHVNREIAKDNDSHMFITVFMAILNTSTGKMVYTNAGHNPPYIIDNKRKLTKLVDRHGPVIGAMDDLTYKESQLVLNNNDIVLIYTDGITESRSRNGELFSDGRLLKLLETGEYSSTETLLELIIKSVKKFEDGADQFDDITVLTLEYCQNPGTI